MKIHICNDNKLFPFLYVDDWYTPEEEKLIWKELDFYSHRPNSLLFKKSELGKGSAKFKDGTSKNKGWRIALDNLYSQRNTSHILRLQPQKIKLEEVQKAISEAGPIFRLYRMTNYDETMINYYDNSDYYKPHYDNFMITTFCWFHRTPKAYIGGDIIFTDINATLECTHNRMVIFPSYYLHEVHPVKMKDKNLEMGWGRYAIVNFFGITKKFKIT